MSQRTLVGTNAGYNLGFIPDDGKRCLDNQNITVDSSHYLIINGLVNCTVTITSFVSELTVNHCKNTIINCTYPTNNITILYSDNCVLSCPYNTKTYILYSHTIYYYGMYSTLITEACLDIYHNTINLLCNPFSIIQWNL